jgi:hypothetical protein
MTKLVEKEKKERKKEKNRTTYEGEGQLFFYLSRGLGGLIAIQGERVRGWDNLLKIKRKNIKKSSQLTAEFKIISLIFMCVKVTHQTIKM